jgi:uncharacterized protein YecE (DUF72 family)
MSKIRFGTCSWKYDSWRGIIYSYDKQINYLQEYSKHYNTVEIDQWFWSLFGVDKVLLPSSLTIQEYLNSVPSDFKFTVKIPNSVTLTHFYRKSKSEPLTENPHFLSAELFNNFLFKIKPLKMNLGPLLFQFEYLNKQKMETQLIFLNKLRVFFEKLDRNYTYAIETRNPQYLNRTYFKFLNELQLHHVILQGYYMPDITSIYRNFFRHIKDKTVIRLHGPKRRNIEKRSKGKWNQIIDPKDEELSNIALMIKDLLDRKIDIYINMNNHYEGSAPLSIKRLEKLLKNIKY